MNTLQTEHSVQTEASSASVKQLFGKKSQIYSESEIVIRDDSSNACIVHGVIVGPKCSHIEQEIEKGVKSFQFQNDKETIENFFRLLYGFKISLTSAKLYKVWLFASSCGYSRSHLLRNILIENVSHLDIASKVSMIQNVSVIPGDFVKKLSLKDIREMAKTIRDPEILRLFVEEAISRYGTDTKALRDHNIKLQESVVEAQQNVAAARQNVPAQKKQPVLDPLTEVFAALGKFK